MDVPDYYCCCLLDGLMPCGEQIPFCKPGYRISCPGEDECEMGGDCEFHVVESKEEVIDAK